MPGFFNALQHLNLRRIQTDKRTQGRLSSRSKTWSPRVNSRFLAGMTAAVMVAALAAIVAPAQAADDGDAYARRLFADHFAAEGKSFACFARRYDAAHLAKHPRQQVRAMKLLVSAVIVPEDKKRNYSFQLGVEFRGKKDKFTTSGDCGHASAFEESVDKLHIGCGVDCDGGGISIEMANGDKSTIIRLDEVAIWNNDKPNDERGRLSAGADDRLFRLDRVDLDLCRPLMDGSEEFAARQKM
jgi:hypothetical protein